MVSTRGGHGSGVPESTPAGFYVFLSDLDLELESNIGEKPDPDLESLVIFDSSRGLRGLYKCHFLSTNIAELRLHRW